MTRCLPGSMVRSVGYSIIAGSCTYYLPSCCSGLGDCPTPVALRYLATYARLHTQLLPLHTHRTPRCPPYACGRIWTIAPPVLLNSATCPPTAAIPTYRCNVAHARTYSNAYRARAYTHAPVTTTIALRLRTIYKRVHTAAAVAATFVALLLRLSGFFVYSAGRFRSLATTLVLCSHGFAGPRTAWMPLPNPHVYLLAGSYWTTSVRVPPARAFCIPTPPRAPCLPTTCWRAHTISRPITAIPAVPRPLPSHCCCRAVPFLPHTPLHHATTTWTLDGHGSWWLLDVLRATRYTVLLLLRLSRCWFHLPPLPLDGCGFQRRADAYTTFQRTQTDMPSPHSS